MRKLFLALLAQMPPIQHRVVAQIVRLTSFALTLPSQLVYHGWEVSASRRGIETRYLWLKRQCFPLGIEISFIMRAVAETGRQDRLRIYW